MKQAPCGRGTLAVAGFQPNSMYFWLENAVHRDLGHLEESGNFLWLPEAIKTWRSDSLLLLVHQQMLMFPEALADAGPFRALG